MESLSPPWSFASDCDLFDMLAEASRKQHAGCEAVLLALDRLELDLLRTETRCRKAFADIEQLKQTEFVQTVAAAVAAGVVRSEKKPLPSSSPGDHLRIVHLDDVDIDPFNDRPLPYVVGSAEFMASPTVGLAGEEQQHFDEEEVEVVDRRAEAVNPFTDTTTTTSAVVVVVQPLSNRDEGEGEDALFTFSPPPPPPQPVATTGPDTAAPALVSSPIHFERHKVQPLPPLPVAAAATRAPPPPPPAASLVTPIKPAPPPPPKRPLSAAAAAETGGGDLFASSMVPFTSPSTTTTTAPPPPPPPQRPPPIHTKPLFEDDIFATWQQQQPSSQTLPPPPPAPFTKSKSRLFDDDEDEDDDLIY